MHTALRATSLTLVGVLEDSLRSDQILQHLFDIHRAGHMVVTLNTPEEMRERKQEGLSVWLYRVVRDDQRVNDPPVRVDPTHVRPPPLPLRLHYLMTAITQRAEGATPENEQLILGKVLQRLHTHPVLRGADLRDDLEGTDASLHVRLESLTLDEIARVWDALDASYQLSVSYEVTLANILPDVMPERIVPVDVALPQYGVSALVGGRA
jgi:hypothetical protein